MLPPPTPHWALLDLQAVGEALDAFTTLPCPAMPTLNSLSVTGAPYREVNSKVATTPKLKVEDKDRVNNSRRIKTVKLNIVKLKALLDKFS